MWVQWSRGFHLETSTGVRHALRVSVVSSCGIPGRLPLLLSEPSIGGDWPRFLEHFVSPGDGLVGVEKVHRALVAMGFVRYYQEVRNPTSPQSQVLLIPQILAVGREGWEEGKACRMTPWIERAFLMRHQFGLTEQLMSAFTNGDQASARKILEMLRKSLPKTQEDCISQAFEAAEAQLKDLSGQDMRLPGAALAPSIGVVTVSAHRVYTGIAKRSQEARSRYRAEFWAEATMYQFQGSYRRPSGDPVSGVRKYSTKAPPNRATFKTKGASSRHLGGHLKHLLRHKGGR